MVGGEASGSIGDTLRLESNGRSAISGRRRAGEVLTSDTLRRVYLQLLKEHAQENQLRILAYCLMTDHLHVVAVPESLTAMANTFRRAHTRFAQYCNTELERTGHVWQNRYFSCPVDETKISQVIAYVETDPVRAGLTQTAGEYYWSSAKAHLELEGDPDLVDRGLFLDLLDLNWWRDRWNPSTWAQFLTDMQLEDWDAVRKATQTGRPLGSRDFVAGLESRLGRRLTAGKVGRPRKIRPGSDPGSISPMVRTTAG